MAEVAEKNNAMKVIPFMSKRMLALAFSGLLMLASVGSLVVQGLNFGLDFTGGTLVELGYSEPADLNQVRDVLAREGFEEARVQYFGTEREVMIRLRVDDNPQLGDQILALMQAETSSDVSLRRSEFVGPAVGEELRDKGGLGMILALAVVMVYVALRFQYKFAVGAVVALIHDVIIVVGVFSFFQLNFDLTVLAAVLAVVGYSLNDSIVVADRIRENFRSVRRDDTLYIVDLSLTQTLGRTMVTSGSTALVLVALLVFGGELIRMFSLALLIGIVVGTYSSVYISAAVLAQMNLSKADMMRPEKKEVETEEDVPDWLKE